MLSKSGALNLFRNVRPIYLSGGIHLLIAAAVGAIVLIDRWSQRVEFSVIEAPIVSVAATLPRQLPPQEQPKPKVQKAKGVYGITKKAILSNEGDMAKLGNTIAKTPDKQTLRTNDPDALPIPAEEYLVSSMPKLLSEVRIPYPPDAKKNSIQGAVVMDILVDADGKVREAKLVEGPGYGLNEAALDAVRGFRFEPAKIEDKSVPVRIRYAYRFILER